MEIHRLRPQRQPLRARRGPLQRLQRGRPVRRHPPAGPGRRRAHNRGPGRAHPDGCRDGFDWHPETGRLWFTDNGRDWLGDDRPPDELNRLTDPPQHFGYPYVHGADLSDPDFGEGHDPADYTAPVQPLGPHVAALGMTFYTGAQFPEAYRGQVFIAEHGSWNRSTKIGYRVTLVRLDSTGTATSYEPFATGWLRDGDNWGRPVDVLQTPDGALLVSDDQTGTIYRISHAP